MCVMRVSACCSVLHCAAMKAPESCFVAVMGGWRAVILKSDFRSAFRGKCRVGQRAQGARTSQWENVNHSMGGL